MTNEEMRKMFERKIDYCFLSLFIGESDYVEGKNFGRFISVVSVAKTLNIISFEEYKKLMDLTEIVHDLKFLKWKEKLQLEKLKFSKEQKHGNDI